MNEALEGQMTIFDLDLPSLKMSKESSVQTTEKTSEPYWKSLSTLSSRKLLYLDLRKNGKKRDTLAEMIGQSHGEPLMLNIGECPNEEKESHLSWILEGGVQEKYYLSKRAAEGILNRASKRGKALPEILQKALQNMIRTPSNLGGGEK